MYMLRVRIKLIVIWGTNLRVIVSPVILATFFTFLSCFFLFLFSFMHGFYACMLGC